uniref:Uncharacterized protein n=1 Tax=Chromera velia CCMP2878 TaxID=1169474 RepID=A0A0G4IAM1_9ALVE|eukprot:Cvel_12620.t1-p1 / transcript=Cvel_12620.t1 / gene=Cvel_12620 / organism=Chromera_velia_CCMP2878 / gene_product=hypothetical protein / transcript_product=hypothetical protein / location=Cvel_scaffold833:7781-8764(+) / protein_length=328 / sequence_SO=supercontig / SO=protein_coding / is_pseudo=false
MRTFRAVILAAFGAAFADLSLALNVRQTEGLFSCQVDCERLKSSIKMHFSNALIVYIAMADDPVIDKAAASSARILQNGYFPWERDGNSAFALSKRSLADVREAYQTCLSELNLWETAGMPGKLRQARDEGVEKWGKACLRDFSLPKEWPPYFLSHLPQAAMKGLKTLGGTPEQEDALLWGLGAGAVNRIVNWGQERLTQKLAYGTQSVVPMGVDDHFKGGCAVAKVMVQTFGDAASRQLNSLMVEQPLRLSKWTRGRIGHHAGSKKFQEGAWADLLAKTPSLACADGQTMCPFAREILVCIPDHWTMLSAYKNFEDQTIKNLPECKK